jgi:hypothetical protein
MEEERRVERQLDLEGGDDTLEAIKYRLRERNDELSQLEARRRKCYLKGGRKRAGRDREALYEIARQKVAVREEKKRLVHVAQTYLNHRELNGIDIPVYEELLVKYVEDALFPPTLPVLTLGDSWEDALLKNTDDSHQVECSDEAPLENSL